MKICRYLFTLISLNYFSGKRNGKELVNRFLEVGATVAHVSQDGHISASDKDNVVQEIDELAQAVIDFLDEIELPE